MVVKDDDKEKKALAKKDDSTLAPTDLSQEEMLALAERRMELLDKVITMALSSTNERDWVSQEGEPYLMGTGSEKIARRFGIKMVGLEKEKEIIDNKGNYKYTFVAEFKLGKNDSIMAIGSCTSRDKFFSRAKGRIRTLEEINPHDIEMKGYTNLLNNGVKRLLGLRNLSWQQLKDAGLDIDKIVGVQYGNGHKTDDKKKVTTPTEKPAIKNPDAPASEKQRKTITETILKSHLMHPAEKFALADQIKKGVNMQIASDIIGFWIGEDRKNKASGERGRREMVERKSKEALASYLSAQEEALAKKKPEIYKAYKESL